MAMKREYLSVDGEIFGEISGGVVNFYDRDALGSVVAIEDGAGNTVSTIEYKPFGDVRTYTGENPLSSPRRFLWCGSWGYRFNERYAQYTSHYVRARHYSSLQGMWSTIDPLYPRERAYGYVENRVTVGIDPSGLSVRICRRPILTFLDTLSKLHELGWLCSPFAGPPGPSDSSTYDHWYLIVDGGTCNTTMGWGPIPDGQSGAGAGMYGIPDPNGSSSNHGGWPKEKQKCQSLTVSGAQEKCLCDNWKSIEESVRKGKGYKLCGKTWDPSTFLIQGSVCQNFVACLLSKCGLGLPWGWTPINPFGSGHPNPPKPVVAPLPPKGTHGGPGRRIWP